MTKFRDQRGFVMPKKCQKRNRILWIIWGIPMLISGCAHAQFQTPPEGGFDAEIPAAWVEQLSFAYKDFRRTVKDASCFKLRTYREDGAYVIDFLPASGVKLEGDRIEIPVGGRTPCGRGMRYEFDSAGKFVRRIGQR